MQTILFRWLPFNSNMVTKTFAWLGLVILTWSLCTPISYAESRIALVIGNNEYRNIPKLKNAVNDAKTIKDELTKLGFQVIYRTNANRRQMHQAVNEFIRRLSEDTAGVVYYSGHGMQIQGSNYLLPVDILRANYAEDVVYDAISMNRLLARMSSVSTKFSLVILDACRDNPFGRSMGGKGLAAPSSNASGIMVIYAAGANQEALDRLSIHDSNPNSLFTREFVKSLRKPNLTVPQLVYDARRAVITQARSVGHVQTPAIYDESIGTFIFNPDGTQSPPPPLPPSKIKLTIRSNVPAGQAQVFIDNAALGMAPLELNLTPGIHQLRLEADGYETWSQELKITRPYFVQAQLTKKPPERKPFEPEMVQIPGGCFQMGSPPSEQGRQNDEKQHQVCVKAFQIGKYEITNAQYRAFKPSHNSGDYNGHNLNGDQQPVVRVSWQDAYAYTQWLARQTGKKYRLPTEAEWEYAARAGTTTSRYWGNDPDQACKYANVHDRTSKRVFSWPWTHHDCDDGYAVTAPVGRFKPNAFGLYDMLGNVWEFTCSDYNNPYNGSEKVCSNSGSSHALRGGCWYYKPRSVRAAYRDGNGNPNSSKGFRVAGEGP